MAENLDRQDENQDQQNTQVEDTQDTQDTQQNKPGEVGFRWKERLGADLGEAPLFQKFEDSEEGLKKAAESHANLEKLLGHEKVPLPKGEDDKEGWQRFNKAMGVPESPEGYELPDPQVDSGFESAVPDKQFFQEAVHKIGMTPRQATKAWETMVEANKNALAQATEQYQNQVNEVANKLKSEWGDAYKGNVELGQSVINKFSGDKETNDFLTATLAKDPRGVKFLADVGKQFAENQIGEFKANRFAKSPAEAQAEIDKITSDPSHPYLNDKATPKEHEEAVKYVNSLYAVLAKRA